MEREQEREGERKIERDEQGEKAKARWRPRERLFLDQRKQNKSQKRIVNPDPQRGGYSLQEPEGFRLSDWRAFKKSMSDDEQIR